MLISILLSITLVFLSCLSITCWLSVPLIIQVIIDKVIVQNNPQSLSILGFYLLVFSGLASGLEIANVTLSKTLINQRLVKERMVELLSTVPPVIIMGIIMNSYSPLLTGYCISLILFVCLIYYFLFKKRIISNFFNQKPLPLLFRLPLSLIAIFTLWCSSQLVLQLEFSLGQLFAFIIFSIYLSSSLLNLTITLINKQPKNSPSNWE